MTNFTAIMECNKCKGYHPTNVRKDKEGTFKKEELVWYSLFCTNCFVEEVCKGTPPSIANEILWQPKCTSRQSYLEFMQTYFKQDCN